MVEGIIEICHKVDKRIKAETDWSIYDFIALGVCICAGLVMLVRCFYGTEITDEAYYVADAKAMLEGNLPYVYCTYSIGSGSAFLLIPLIALYKIFQSDLAGVFLYSRLCFLFMWYMILYVIYRIICKNTKRWQALFFVGMLIPYKAGRGVLNFSYNTVPCVLMLLVAFLIYDALENKSRYYFAEILISGFISCTAFFAQPGYGLAIMVFLFLLLMRSQGIKSKVENIVLYGIGGIIEVCMVFIPLIIQTGIETTCAGLSRYFNAYPSNKTMSTTTPFSRAENLFVNFLRYVLIYILLCLVVYIIAKCFIWKKEKNITNRECKNQSVIIAGFLFALFLFSESINTNAEVISYKLGVIGAIIFCITFLVKIYEKRILLLYVGLYPILFAVGEAIMVDSNNTIERFAAAVPTLAICLFFFMEEESTIVHLLSVLTVILCIIELNLNAWNYIYRDAEITQLRYQVNEGVYKGIYTTKQRAFDLPELENYLNQYLEEGEYYEFHDNVPCGYLMMHTGEICSIATWDSLNYTYNKNAPSELYEYYRRRRTIPDKLFYVDFGRDENLSIEDSEFQYNEFVETYYEKIDEVKLNDTFYHVIIYEYKGGFDEDYDYWIDRHMIDVYE